ncbi:hypothetical protein ACFWPU_00760 [Streptomyces sp. NPDC058471]|uniref:DUF6197 family protein n=1 Tax=Streptomyces sp. NPDC058471 TaxID=3346516 RepID=UPI003647DC01
MNKADVYRKAAEVIVRDGMVKGSLFSDCPSMDNADYVEAVGDLGKSVCAIGACVRAQYELYGTAYGSSRELIDQAYRNFNFMTEIPARWGGTCNIQMLNDAVGTSVEDVALELKRRAEMVDDGVV